MINSITLEKNQTVSSGIGQQYTTEEALIEGCIQKDKTAQKQLYVTYYGQMLGVCFRYINERAEAEDVVHDCFIQILNKIKNFKSKSKLSSWMTRIVINGSLAYLKKKKRLPIDYDLPIEHVEQRELKEDELDSYSCDDILGFIHQLPIGYKTVLCLYSIDGLSHKEISESLSISESTSRSQLYRGRQLLRELLSQQRNHG